MNAADRLTSELKKLHSEISVERDKEIAFAEQFADSLDKMKIKPGAGDQRYQILASSTGCINGLRIALDIIAKHLSREDTS